MTDTPVDQGAQTPVTLNDCPFCGAQMHVREHSAFHPNGNCWLATAGEFAGPLELDESDYEGWNRRTQSATEGAQTFEEWWDADKYSFLRHSNPRMAARVVWHAALASRDPKGGNTTVDSLRASRPTLPEDSHDG